MSAHYLFLSHILSETTPSYSNRDLFTSESMSSISQGDSANTSSWKLTNNHIGTHIDLPYHFDENGRRMQDFTANELVFKDVFLIEIPCNVAVLINSHSYFWESIPEKTEMLLIRTGFENFRNSEKYMYEYPSIGPELLKDLRAKLPLLRCIGFDFISLTSPVFKSEGKASHIELLVKTKNNEPILIIEDMCLRLATNTIKRLFVAPVRVLNADGGPVTVLAEY